jgi:DNA-binding transcriptional LysR family regulator
MQQEHPQVRTEISELELEQALPGLRLGAVDLVISDEYDGHPRPRPRGLRFALLHQEPLKLVLSAQHPLAAQEGPLPMSQLQLETWVASEAGTGHHEMVVGSCRSVGGYEPDIRHGSSDADVQLDLVRTTGAVALLPALTLPPADPSLAFREVAEKQLGRQLVLVTRDGPPTPALAAFKRILSDVVRKIHRA